MDANNTDSQERDYHVGIVYQAEHKESGRSYIGVTRQPIKQRIAEHKSKAKKGSRTPFHVAIRKEGIKAFEWCVLYEIHNTDEKFVKEEIHKLERECIKKYDAVDSGYNKDHGGGRNYWNWCRK